MSSHAGCHRAKKFPAVSITFPKELTAQVSDTFDCLHKDPFREGSICSAGKEGPHPFVDPVGVLPCTRVHIPSHDPFHTLILCSLSPFCCLNNCHSRMNVTPASYSDGAGANFGVGIVTDACGGFSE